MVIAIIAILAALLLPALNKAKERGRQILCVSNLKQLGLGFNYYAEANEGYFPRRTEGAVFPVYWRQHVHGYVDEKTDLFQCPSDDNFSWANLGLSYGYNYYGSDGGNGFGYSSELATPSKSARFSRFEDPSGTLVVADSNSLISTNEVSDIILHRSFGENYPIGVRHFGGPNALWADGHVEWKPQLELDDRTAATLHWWTLEKE